MVFLVFISVFYSTVVSSLNVRLYASRLLADAFCSKSVRPKVLISLRIRKSCNYNRHLPIYH